MAKCLKFAQSQTNRIWCFSFTESSRWCLSVGLCVCVRARICFIFRFVFLFPFHWAFLSVLSFLHARNGDVERHLDMHTHTHIRARAHSDFDFVMKWRRTERNREKNFPNSLVFHWQFHLYVYIGQCTLASSLSFICFALWPLSISLFGSYPSFVYVNHIQLP